MTSCTATFQEDSAKVGETIHADFTWTDAKWRGLPYFHYAGMWIEDPNGDSRIDYFELSNATGSKTLEFKTDMAGTWRCLIKVWDGSKYVECTDTVPVSGPTSCTASFWEASAKVGDTIHADFTWANAVKHGTYLWYAVMHIEDPNGNSRVNFIEFINATGSKTLQFKTDKVGTWKCQIDVWQGVFYVTCTDYVAVTEEGEWTLDEALTCEWVEGYNNHGPLVTEFDIGEDVYAYIEIHGPDMYGKTVRHEWWYKEIGQSEFTKRWSWAKTCESHYTEWATWTWWDIGSDIGPGEGYIKVYFEDEYLGKTNNYTVLPSDECIGGIGDSTFNEGPFPPGTRQLLATVRMENRGTQDGCLILAKFVEYPGEETKEKQLGDIWNKIIDHGKYKDIDFYWDTPTGVTKWPLGVKVWADEYEEEPVW